MFSGCCESRDNVSKAGKGKIDLLGLLQVLALDSTLPDLFAARQVDEAQFSPVLLVVTAMNAIHEENGMTPRRTVIIVSTSDLPILISESDQIHHFQVILHLHLYQTLQNDCIIQFLQPHSFCRLFERVEQVDQLLVVDLQDGASDLISLRLAVEDQLQRSRDQSIILSFFEVAKHGEGFSRAGLPIGEDCRVLSLKKTINMMPCDCIEHLLLRCKLSKNAIETVLILTIIYHGLVVSNIRRNVAWPEPAVNLDIILFLSTAFARLAHRSLLIICGTFHECLRQIDGDLMDWGVAFQEVGPGWGCLWGWCEGGEEVAVW